MTPTDHSSLRRAAYAVMITAAVAAVCGRIAAINLVYEPYLYREDPRPVQAAATARVLAAATPLDAAALATGSQTVWDRFDPNDRRRIWPRHHPRPVPTLGSNDRARWNTARALVDHGTFAIGRRDTDPETGTYRDTGLLFEEGWTGIDRVLRPDNRQFYSSKPPLLPALAAGQYWLLKRLFGLDMADPDDMWIAIKVMLVTINALPLLIYLILLASLVERYGTTDWGRLFVMGAACFGTFLNPFAVTFNNHTVAACAALFALYPALRIWEARREADASGLPLNGASAYHFLLAGFFAGFVVVVELPALAFTVALFAVLLVKAPGRTLLWAVPAAAIPVAAHFTLNYLALDRLTPAYGDLHGPLYQYEGSHWKLPAPGQVKHGIDWAFQTETRADYVFHFLVGHHGVFSLSPIWLLSLAGMARGLFAGRGSRAGPWLVAGLTLYLTVVVIGFYLTMIERWNYGGWTSGPRWVIWLTPFWLLTLLPAADGLASRRWGRGLAYVLLAVSVFSVSYPALNPWRHPWLYQVLEGYGWIRGY